MLVIKILLGKRVYQKACGSLYVGELTGYYRNHTVEDNCTVSAPTVLQSKTV